MNTADVLWAFGSRINDRDWDSLAALLHEDLRVRLLHTGEEFDKAGTSGSTASTPSRSTSSSTMSWPTVTAGEPRSHRQ